MSSFSSTSFPHHKSQRRRAVSDRSTRPADLVEALNNRPEPGLLGYSVADLCRRWKVGADKIHTFIRRGELVAVNVATNLSARPQWRVTREAVELFERRRTSPPPPKPSRQRRQARQTDYYPD
jgi:hypothetical protein